MARKIIAYVALLSTPALLYLGITLALGPQPQRSHQPAASSVQPVTGEATFDDISAADIELDNGSVECLVAADGPARVSWEVVAGRGADAAKMKVQVSTTEGTLHVSDDWQGGTFDRKPEVRVKLWLAREAVVDIALGNGSVISALDGTLAANVGNGGVELTGAPRSVDISVGNGGLEGTALLAAGSHRVDIGNGGITLRLLPGTDTKISASSGMGGIETHDIDGQHTRDSWVGGEFKGKIGAGAGSLDLSVGNGGIELLTGAET